MKNNNQKSLPVLQYETDGFYIMFHPGLELMAYSQTKEKAIDNFDKLLLTFCDHKSIESGSKLNTFIINNTLDELRSDKDLIQNAKRLFGFLDSAENLVIKDFPISLTIES